MNSRAAGAGELQMQVSLRVTDATAFLALLDGQRKGPDSRVAENPDKSQPLKDLFESAPTGHIASRAISRGSNATAVLPINLPYFMP